MELWNGSRVHNLQLYIEVEYTIYIYIISRLNMQRLYSGYIVPDTGV